MTTGTIVIYKFRSVILDSIAPLSFKTSVHKFHSVSLQSGFWDNKPIPELILERKKKIMEYNHNKEQYTGCTAELKHLIKAKKLDAQLSDKSQNSNMKRIMQYYNVYFDEESGNTREEGINQLQKYLVEERNALTNIKVNLEKEIDEIEKEMNSKLPVE